jgi:hypothetical protein
VNADSGQGQLFRAYLGGRLAVWAIALGTFAAVIYGAWKGSWAIALAGPAAVVLGVTAIAWLAADRAAAHRFYSRFAESVGLSYASRAEVLTLTPLLGAGSRQHTEHWMFGRLPGGLEGGVGHFVWERTDRDSDGDQVVRERNRFTICVADLEASMSLFRGVFLRPRRGLIASYSDWLGSAPTRVVEVESAEFGRRYELRRATDQDEILLRRLLSPSLVSWLANHPLTPGFELKAGALCVFVPRPLEDAGNITFLIDATRYLAGRIVAEVDEERTRVA